MFESWINYLLSAATGLLVLALGFTFSPTTTSAQAYDCEVCTASNGECTYVSFGCEICNEDRGVCLDCGDYNCS